MRININNENIEKNESQQILKRDQNGTFKRIRNIWSLDNFNDGYIDSKERFRVWCPEHIKSYKEGYILRSRVAYEAYHGVVIPLNTDVHHIDGNKLNDTKENLKLLVHDEHTKFSNSVRSLNSQIKRVCKHCGKYFIINKWRLKEPTRGIFCSQECYKEHPISNERKQKTSKSMLKVWKERTPEQILDVKEKIKKSWKKRREGFNII